MAKKPSKKLPALPYNGGSGWSGSTSSRERAEYLDAAGITAKNQRIAFKAVASKGTEGLTVHELEEFLPECHHGGRSGPLSNLEKAGHLVLLKGKRGGAQIYVTPENVGDSEIAIPRECVKRDTLLEVLAILKEYIQTDNLARAIWFINKEEEKWDPKKKKKKKK